MRPQDTPVIAALGLAAMALAAVACAGRPDVAPAPAALQYHDPAAATYTVSDSARFSVDAGAMGPMDVTVAHAGTADVRFGDRGPGPGAGWAATIVFTRLRGSFANPQGTFRVDEDAIGGPFRVAVGPRGYTAITHTPTLHQRLREIAGPESLIRPLFVQLPGQPAGVGTAWVDTVTTTESAGGTSSTARTVITSTLAGDTAVDGQAFLVIRTVAENVIEIRGTSGGVEVAQELSGTTRGTVLWDPRSSRLVSRTETGDLAGTLDLPGMGISGLEVSGSVRRRVTLVP